MRETPVLELDSGETITQSNAILWYLAEGTPYLPDSRLERALVAQWLHFEQERVMGGIGSARFRIMTGRDPALAAARFPVGEGALEVLDEHLAGSSFLVGERCSIADVSVFRATRTSRPMRATTSTGYPAVGAWLGARTRAARLPRRPRAVPRERPAQARAARSTTRRSSLGELALPLPSARRARSRAWRASSGRSRHRARPGSGGGPARARRPRADGRRAPAPRRRDP